MHFYKHQNESEVVVNKAWRKGGKKEGSSCFSPSEARHQLTLVVQVLLDLLPHVKDGTVPTVEGQQERMSGVISGASD